MVLRRWHFRLFFAVVIVIGFTLIGAGWGAMYIDGYSFLSCIISVVSCAVIGFGLALVLVSLFFWADLTDGGFRNLDDVIYEFNFKFKQKEDVGDL